jgi:aspartyl-tRNA(Asn)/glutamyl-tRNA(Gln) amidotransferase subunit B
MSITFEAVIGLEVHAQLNTKTKLFCSCSTEFGADANTQVCPICMGFPGTLPVMNRGVLNKAVTAGLALGCDIQNYSAFDRKNYFYPDLPKAYQVSQMFKPICLGGELLIEKEDGTTKKVNITRIHIEEDAGKLVHGENIGSADSSYVDLNRSSIPLIEIVSEPEMTSGEEARLYMQKIYTILQYANVSDCSMEEGSLRCDANVSIRPVGQEKLGTRVEIKNMNSFRNVQKAVEYEIKRQEALIREGGSVRQETRLWDNDQSVTKAMRSKEDAHDYRYFPEPDLQQVYVSDEYIEELRQALPELPDSRKARFINDYKLPVSDAVLLVSDIAYADYYEQALAAYNNPKLVANWLMGEVLRAVNDKRIGIFEVMAPEDLAALVKLVDTGVISGKQGKDLFPEAVETGKKPADIVKEKGMQQLSDTGELDALVQQVIAANPKEAERYRGGDTKLQGFFVGQIMKVSGGKANPQMVNELIKKNLS